MFGSESFKEYMNNTHTISTDTRVVGEWNMNESENIEEVGNYRHRPSGTVFKELPKEWTEQTEGNAYTWGATDCDVVVEGNSYDDDDNPILFTDKKTRMAMLYSLDECFKHHRPRSGINKPLFLGYTSADAQAGQYLNNYGGDIAKRPRYYMGSRYDSFKYWTSYRTEGGGEYGVSDKDGNIEDVVPYVVYKEPVPANRIVFKMQSNIGSVNLGQLRYGDTVMPDPLFGIQNSTLPSDFSVEVLIGKTWEPAYTSDENTVINEDGYFELEYGAVLPSDFRILGEFEHFSSLPVSAKIGDTYWIQNESIYYVYEQDGNTRRWVDRPKQIGWRQASGGMEEETTLLRNLTKETGVEATYIRGIRLVVRKIHKSNSAFDLIEMSPRLVVDFSQRAQNFNITKIMSDLGSSTLPVGSLQASTGAITLNNDDGVLSYNNPDSIIAPYLYNNFKFSFYDVVRGARLKTDNDAVVEKKNVYVPVKTIYTQGFPQASGTFDNIDMTLRDAYFILEREQAPELFLQDVSLSFAITMLLDHIGFSNYKFLRKEDVPDPVIPYFFVSPGKNVAQVLQELAIATQSSMWFDEENNFCVAMKEYSLPSDEWREKDGVLSGDNTEEGLANIIAISSDEKRVANDGAINYTERYLQREYASLKQAYNNDQWRNYVYKPTMLWQVQPDTLLRTYNTTSKEGQQYALSAIPLAADIPNEPPKVVGGKIVNNIIEFGEGISWLGRAQGYFYANGEIIRFDAMEVAVSGTGVVWIEDNDDYQDYFANLPFNGKIYPTGRVRIYAEPYYDNYISGGYDEDGNYVKGEAYLKEEDVKEHGRAQFGTAMVEHNAGLGSFWSDDANCYGMQQDTSFMFTADQVRKYPADLTNPTAKVNASDIDANARASKRGGIIKNFLADTYQVERDNLRFGTTNKGTVQASALVFEGPPSFEKRGDKQVNPVENISYIYKNFVDPDNDAPYHHFGTRMSIIGELISQSNLKQKAIGAGEYVSLQADDPSQAVSLVGGSGGIGVQVNPETNEGYFLEIVALSNDVQARINPNPVYGAKLRVSNKNVTLTTAVEHNIKKGDRFIITSKDPQQGVTQVIGEWEAKGIGKTSVDFRAEPATTNFDSGDNYSVEIQRVTQDQTTMSSIFFYKIKEKDGELIPYVLWEGISEIIVNDGKFTDIMRVVGQEKTSVYDLSIEYSDVGNFRRFYLSMNGMQMTAVEDPDPIPNPKNSVVLFTRGNSKCQFNNVYALTERVSENPAATAVDSINKVFGTESITQTEALRKYGVSGFVQQAYLKGIKTEGAPDYQMYFDEFGSIMRECDYLNIKYDLAYPAMSAILAPNINNNRTYVTSGFMAGAYGAEFLVFNTTDAAITLDAESGNFLRILGVAFTQDTTKELTADNYYNKVADLSSPKMQGRKVVVDPNIYKEQYDRILESRQKFGRQEFQALQSDYIQDDSVAENMLGWIMSKTHKPRQLLGINVFGMPHMRLNDIYSVDYKVTPNRYNGIMDAVTDSEKQFVAYQIDYSKDQNGVNMTAYLVEV